MRIADVSPDIIGLTEMKPKNPRYILQKAEIGIDGYECWPAISSSGRGVAIYTKTALQATAVTPLPDCSFKDAIWCEIRLCRGDKLLVGCVYRSPNSTNDNNALLLELLKSATNGRHSHVVIMGDFNYPEIDWIRECSNVGVNHQATKFMEGVRDTFMHQHVEHPTHRRGNHQANALDLIFSNEQGMVDNVEHNLPIGKSHHVVLQLRINCYCELQITQKESVQYHRGDYEGFNEYLSQQDWSLMDGKSVTDQWDNFEDIMKPGIDIYIPHRTVDMANAKSRKPLWMNMKALAKVRKKTESYKRYLETREGRDYELYCKARNQARRATRQAMKQFEKEVAKNAKTNPKTFHKYVNSKTKVRTGIGELQVDDVTSISDEEKASTLNKYFSSVYTKEDTKRIPTCENHAVRTPCPRIQLSRNDVYRELQALNPTKSAGPDNLYPIVLKETASTIAGPLLRIFQLSLDTGEVPAAWQRANVTPIFKKGNRKEPGNYRPISLTCICCKVLEKFIRQTMVNHMAENDLLTNDQHGFWSGRSCTTQLLSVIETWTDQLEKGIDIDVLYFDFSKAFDMVPHRRLLSKLESYKVSQQITDWVEAYLSNRKQRVLVNGTRSEWEAVSSGVPQGSVLGPVLFLIYINDLPKEVKNCIRLFADDTKLYRTVTTDLDCLSLQQDIDNIEEWASKWQLKFHPKKCKTMRIGDKYPRYNYTMTAEDGTIVKLEETVVEKDLGVVVDNKLTFSHHINSIVARANQVMGMIRRSFKYMDKDIFVQLFTSRVRPILEYGNVIWSPRLIRDIDAVERVQRRATKTVPGISTMTYPDRLQTLRLPSLVYRRARGDMIETYKYLHNVCVMCDRRVYSEFLQSWRFSTFTVIRRHRWGSVSLSKHI